MHANRRCFALLHLVTVLALLLSTLGGATLTPPAALAASTSDTVTLAGSLQDELGCAGDWDPACTNTELPLDSGDDIFQQAFDLPAGSFEYKAAINGTWDENYGANATPNGPNIPLTLDAAETVKFYFDPATNWITSNRNHTIAVVAGDFQSEQGCPGDWQPDCLRSWLQDIDDDGIYRFSTTSLPAGSYEAKVAIDESWDENYGAGGVPNGDNIPFTVANTGDAITFSWDSESKILTIQTGALPPVDLAEIAEAPARHPIEDDIFYFVMPDRFANGDTANDEGGLSGDRLATGFDPTDKGFYHGGDLAGLMEKLPYLDEMGITAIWMTPVFKNKPVQGAGADASAGYHGYWITDFTQFDPHFGTNAELVQLIDAAHTLGIKVFFDIITNHTADVIDYEEDQYSYRSKADYPYLDADGQPFDDRDYAGTDTFPPLDREISFPYTPIIPAGEETIKVPDWLNNPIYYHNRGDSSFQGENSLYGDFFGLDDLFTEQPQVVEGMTEIYKDWISDFDIDGFRIDTVKHVNAEFWRAFAPAILAHAQAEGKPDFFIFGEVFSSNEQFLSYYTTDSDMPAVLDFKFQERLRGYVSQTGSAQNLQSFFEDDDYFIDEDSNAYSLPTFIGNHDIGRFGFFLNADNGGGLTDDQKLARSKLANATMYFGRGVPVIYYGDEQGFTGDGGDKDARQDMFPSQVESYNDDDLIGTDATTADDNFDPTHPLYQAFVTYAGIYQAHTALRTGAQIHRYAADGPGIYAFSRIDRDEQVEYVVALNNGAAATANVPTFYANGVQFSLVYAEGGSVADTLTTDANGELAVSVPEMGFVIYQAGQPIPASSEAPAVNFASLASGQEVTLGFDQIDGNQVPQRLEVRADLAADSFAEVTFAVRETGTEEFTVIGVDDNAPYRVFYDASAWPEGTQLDFLAVVNDLHAHYEGAFVEGVTVHYVDTPPPPPGGAGYAVVHYQRSDGNYGDPTSDDFNDFWGLHAWGDGLASNPVTWENPIRFWGEDDYGRFAWIQLQDSSKDVGFIVHRGEVKDGTDADRSFNPATDGPEIWLKQDDPTFYTSQAAAQGYVNIHYHRDDGNYTDWGLHLWGDGISEDVVTEWASPRPPDGSDAYGIFWQVPIEDATLPLNFIIHKGDEKDPGPDQSLIPQETAAVWIQSGNETIYPQLCAATDTAVLHYRRPAGDYGDYNSTNFADFWGLHTWQAAEDPGWTMPRKPDAFDPFGAVFNVPLIDPTQNLAYIFHRGDEKDPGPDQFLDFDTYGCEVWQLQGADPEAPYILPVLSGPRSGADLSKERAHWLNANTIAWDTDIVAGNSYQLHYAPEGGIILENNVLTGGSSIPLEYVQDGLPPELAEKWPYLAAYKLFRLHDEDLPLVPDILKGQIIVSAGTASFVADATGVQIPGVLDDLYTYEGALGVTFDGDTPTIRLWAPTAKLVKLHLFDDTSGDATQMLDMTPGEQGTWGLAGDPSWLGKYYLFEVEVYVPSTGQVEHNLVTDPYSLGLAPNSTRSLIVDLDDPTTQPQGWGTVAKPPLAAPEDIVLYELHVRDFSISDESVPADLRGTFEAFTDPNTLGMQHLIALAQAGLTHIHLLPAFDFATVREIRSQQEEPPIEANPAPDSPQPQEALDSDEDGDGIPARDEDGFNWGYDPYHYTVPEGSYATDPAGVTRIVEFRDMVQALHEVGLRVVMDVVYNHTTAAGQAERSVLDKIVPGYYHRLNLDGEVETSTCCSNTASEHTMFEKLMLDSLSTWASEYDVDGFRFDLMGHHMVSNMEKVQSTLAAIDPSIYIYGEGWNFGEVVDNARGVNATQFNLAGTGIGTFNDRLRDAVRGGGPFDSGADLVTNQGFSNGLWYDPNANNDGSDDEKAKLLLYGDQIRVGLAGNLADYQFIDRNGNLVSGSEVDYNGSPAGYNQDPQEHIVYVEAHDNQTLYDNNAYKLPLNTTPEDRVRAQNMGLDFDLLAQGVPFVHAGSELLRSKSMDRNSYNSGDWFNRLDWSYQENNFGVGLPPAGENGANWDLIAPRLTDPLLHPDPADISASNTHLQEILMIRKSSSLFRLEDEAAVMARLVFHNTGPDQIPGLIVMSLSDEVAALPDLDPQAEQIVVLFNASDTPQSFTLAEMVGRDLHLHPVQMASADPVVQGATFDPATGAFTVPPRTTAVFVQGEQQATPAITIVLDTQPNSRQNFRFTGGLGNFRLDDVVPDDRDPFSQTKTFAVEPGDYTVTEHVPGKWLLTEIRCDPAASAAVDLANNQVTIAVAAGSHVTCTFVNQGKSIVRAHKYEDRNGNGRKNGGERPLADWRFLLYDAQGTLVPTENDLTNKQGKMRYPGLRPGNYTICEELRAGWFNTQPGLIDATYQQPCYLLTVGPGQIAQVHFGNVDRPVARSAQSSAIQGMLIFDAPDVEVDEANYDAVDTDEAWLNAPDTVGGLFMPMIRDE
ncbi:MAG: pullulanase-type alpha-1,6-glucosidase [Caldilineaceae bacterium]|nr:pullulanase-type alpha-1,6-glucosidase [Caldilineaceae bacterium]